ncbi:putative 4-carboxymuconolactone decarboxylase [Viridothelium virens]|uniref:Putative 4-carboxymuconolactone decarboxylase n=1 Tax=Viridothelium virens TaxID=1048519 RepID=A0A6A6H6S3_VIRVR|nr:putative 4-carboxymuconolactone decarboxylase [Viridothelium virens]
MRVPYAQSNPPADSSADVTQVYDQIRARRHPRPLIPLDLALLNSPPVASGWSSFLGAIRGQTSLESRVSELPISRVAVLNQAVHEWEVHGALAHKAGVSQEGMETVRTAQAGVAESGQKGNGEGGLSKKEWALIAYTDQMTTKVKVDDAVFARLKEVGFSDREVVEITATVAAYNCVSRFLVALDVGEENGHALKSVEELSNT